MASSIGSAADFSWRIMYVDRRAANFLLVAVAWSAWRPRLMSIFTAIALRCVQDGNGWRGHPHGAPRTLCVYCISLVRSVCVWFLRYLKNTERGKKSYEPQIDKTFITKYISYMCTQTCNWYWRRRRRLDARVQCVTW